MLLQQQQQLNEELMSCCCCCCYCYWILLVYGDYAGDDGDGDEDDLLALPYNYLPTLPAITSLT